MLPAQLDTGHGPVNLSPPALRRIGCHATLAGRLINKNSWTVSLPTAPDQDAHAA